MIVKSEGMVSEHDYLFGQKRDKEKIVDVKSDMDFPTLEIAPAQAKKHHGGPIQASN